MQRERCHRECTFTGTTVGDLPTHGTAMTNSCVVIKKHEVWILSELQGVSSREAQRSLSSTSWSWMVWLDRSMSTRPPLSCEGPRSTSHCLWMSQNTPTCRSSPAGVVCQRVCKVCLGWIPELERGHFAMPRLEGFFPRAGQRCCRDCPCCHTLV